MTFIYGYDKMNLLNRGAGEHEYLPRTVLDETIGAAIWERVSPPKRENRPFHAGHTGEYPYDCRAK